MPPLKPRENNYVRGGFVGTERGRGRGLRRLAPLAIREPQNGDQNQLVHEAERGRRIGILARRWSVHGGPDLPREPIYRLEVISDDNVAPEQPPPVPLALPELVHLAPNSIHSSPSEGGTDLPIQTTPLNSSRSLDFVPVVDCSDEEI